MKNTSGLLIIVFLIGMLASTLPAHATQMNTQSESNSAAPPDSEFLLFPDATDSKSTAATKPAAESKPAATDQKPQAAAPETEAPHANTALAPMAPRPPRLIAPPSW